MRLELHNQCLTVKLSRTQMRRLKALARSRGKRVGVWAREELLGALLLEDKRAEAAKHRNGVSNGKLASPVLRPAGA